MSDPRWQRIEEIFHQAGELPLEARPAFLSEACAGDEALRQEVASLLDHDADDGRTFLGAADADILAGANPQSIAHYRISEKLGEGGMGAVYRATDTKLGRDVAIKVLPEAFADDPSRMARFAREAKVLASLNHPNIAAIYGVEERALIMELVHGKDLRGPLPVATVLNYARQLAGALDAAHEKGIVHRDLKPANIRVTPDGVVKVLDFGLAKFSESTDGISATADSPSVTARTTGAGAIMGTAAYMAPEQARGEAVDKRADIWAFGVVTYELLTGKMLFGAGGKSLSDSPAAVLTNEPDFDALPEDTPPRLRRLLERCLRKDQKQRLRDIGDALILLDEVEPESAPPARRWIPWTVGAVLAIALLAGVGWLLRRSSDPAPVAARFLLPLPSGTSSTAHIMSTHAVPSPDGRYLVIVAQSDSSGRPGLWVRPLGSAAAQPLEHTEGASLPFWSPDSQYIAFFAGDKLKRIAVSGGVVQTICDVPRGGDGGTWNQQGVIVFATYGPGALPLMQVPASGGVPTSVTTLEADEKWHCWPQFLPDGRHLLYYAIGKDAAHGAIYVQEIGNAKRVRVLKNTTRGVWAPPGYLLFAREGTLFAQRMDSSTFQLEGEPLAVAQDIAFNEGNGRNAVFASQNGVLVYRSTASSSMRQLSWYSREGQFLGSVGKPGEFLGPTLSPDEKSVALLVGPSGRIDLWVLDLASGVMTRMTQDSQLSVAMAPVWAPDSQHVAVSRITTGIQQVALASGKVTPLSKEPVGAWDWSPDGNSVLCNSKDQLAQLFLPGGPRLQPILDATAGKKSVRFSPDGRYVVYTSNESGQDEIYVASFPAFAANRKISSAGGRFPVWEKGGKEILYRGADGAIMCAEIRTEPGLSGGAPKLLFKNAGSDLGRFSVTSDGKRFLINATVQKDEGEKPDINVILNWTSGIK